MQRIDAWLAPLAQWLANFDDGPQRVLPIVARRQRSIGWWDCFPKARAA
ncbi:hypothetical protein [Paraburkholderia terrae]|nr:hypothetical protein [Paraburkholderia terrae]